MADFVAILKKTIDGQGITTPELRARVYARARQTIEQKLAALDPAPTSEQKARQMKSLDDAIVVVEQDYTPASPKTSPATDPLEAFISAAEASNKTSAPRAPEPKPAPAPVAPVMPRPSLATPKLPVPPAPVPPRVEPKLSPANSSESLAGSPASEKQSSRTLVWLLLGAIIAAGAGYGIWIKKDELTAYFQSIAPAGTTTGTNVQPEVKKVATTTIKPESQNVAPATPAENVEPALAPVAPADGEAGEQKFTQRLTPEGQEVDTGPASGTANAVGEGESVAQVTTPAATTDPAAPAQTPPDPATPATIAVGQKAVFYEEKTGTEEGTVDGGSVVWSTIQDAPAADKPEEPAIRAEITVPDKGVNLRLTIKRNADKTLPASHIIEMVFSVPEGFSGGSIEGVQRVTFKDTEQAPGNPLVGVPAAFGDGFFLIALTDEKTAIEANMALMTRQSWIDIPITYKSGRRALISIEKGIPGDKVFLEVFKAWQAKAAG
jgi:hypothetical protein